MMSENSVDYIARFNDLAQELSVSETSLPPPWGQSEEEELLTPPQHCGRTSVRQAEGENVFMRFTLLEVQ